MKKTLVYFLNTMILVPLLFLQATPMQAMDDWSSPYTETDNRNSEYTDEQQRVLDNIPELEKQYLEYGLQAPVSGDIKGISTRSAIGGWSWRDGVICVTTEGFGTDTVNTWHAAIVAPQDDECVAEAPKPGEKVRLRNGIWYSDKHTIWQVGVNSTTVDQDWNAGYWAGRQVGSPYNLNFWDARQTNSFYCSQLVWAAYYYTCGVDLNKSDNDILGAIAIHPGEFVENNNTTIIFRNR